MLVMTIKKVPPRLRGLLSRWLVEVQTGVYVGRVNLIVRDLLWRRALEIDPEGQMSQAWNTNSDQGYDFRGNGDDARKTFDLDGFKLGTNNLKAIDRLKGVQSIKDKAKNNPHNKRALAFVSSLNYKALMLWEIADLLNMNGFKTSTGKDFGTTQVIRVLAKLDPSKNSWYLE